MKRFNLRLLVLLVFITTMSVTIISVAANEPSSPLSIQLIPNGGEHHLDQSNFPDVKLKFYLMRGGRYFNDNVNESNFILFEDGKEVQTVHDSYSKPFFITTIISMQSYADMTLDKHEHLPEQQVMTPIWEFMKTNDSIFQICFTQNKFPCRKYTNEIHENVSGFYEEVRGDILRENRQMPISVADVIYNVMDNVKQVNMRPIILIIRLPSRMNDAPDIPQDMIQEINDRGGKLIIVDIEQTPRDNYMEEIRNLENMGVSYYSKKGVSSCGAYSGRTYIECINQDLTLLRTVEHELTFSSLLLHDQEDHQIFLQLILDNGEKSDTENIPFRISPIMETSDLRKSVKIANNLIIGVLFPIGLIAILIMVIGSQDRRD